MSARFAGRYLAYRPSERRVLQVASATPPGGDWLKPDFSVVSPGTEGWRMRSARDTDIDVPLGYMSIGIDRNESILAPVPHGASFPANAEGVLRAAGAGQVLAVARFQLMAALALHSNEFLFRERARVTVMGSGPVAVGAVLELLRSGVERVCVRTSRVQETAELFAGVACVEAIPRSMQRAEDCILECTGDVNRISECLGLLSERGTLGLLGSPREQRAIDLYTVHRKGILLVGMHELIGVDRQPRQRLFSDVVTWLTDRRIDRGHGWFRISPPEEAARRLSEWPERRPAEPFQLIDWRDS